MSDRGTDGLLDDVVRALGVDCDPPPSRIVAASRLIDAFCEGLERDSKERGKREVDVEAILGAVLDHLEDRCGHAVFQREKWEEALMAVEASGRRGNLQSKPLISAPAGHEAQPMPTETKWDKKPAMTRAEATNFVDHVLAARFGKTNRDVTDEILAGVYGGERKADMGNTDFAPDWGRGTPAEAGTMDPERA